MVDFLTHLFDTSDFPPRWYCGNWTDGLGWLHILSDLAVWSAYVAIPCVLGYFVLRRRDMAFRTIFLLFGAFILACGTTHLMEAIIFWWPAYRLAGVIKLFTGIVSWATVFALIPATPKALALRTPDELRREIAARTNAELALVRANGELGRQVEALRASEERFRLLVEGTKDYAIFMLDPTGLVASWNAGAERINQYRAAEIMGQHFSLFYPIEEVKAGKPQRALQLAVATGQFEEEGWRLRKDGTRFWASVVITALRDSAGKLQGFAKITRDMTERKQADENARRLLQEAAARRAAEEHAAAIAEEQERQRVAEQADLWNREIFQLVHKIGKIGHWEWNAVTDENKWTPEIEALYGLPPGGFQGGYQGWAMLLHPEDRPKAEAEVRQSMVTGEYFTEFRVVWPDGSVHWLETRAKLFKDDDGRPLRMVGVNMDVTERKRVEEELQRSRRELQQRFEQLAEADRRKNEFLAILAHELRNPLAPIRNGVQVLQLANDSPAREQALKMMDRQVGQMVRLIDDLLDISRVSRNKLELRKARITLATVIENAVETARPLIDSKRQTLMVSLCAEPVYLDADLIRLAQVFWNLLNNAAKYTDAGGRIELSAQLMGSEVVVKVRDTGIGIPAEALAELFTLFSQVDHSLERSQGGLGIGLALAKGLVEMHGGRIEVRSDGPGMGSEFVVQLPLSQGDAQTENKAPTDTKHPIPKRRILIVDDNRDAAATFAMLLSELGHDTRTAHDGLEAIELAEAFRPELVLLDIGLPRLNGYDVCRRIREQQWGRDMVIVAITGWGQEDDRRRSKEAGFNRHLIKPIDFAALESLLAELK